jgi:hypothetical protein
MVALLVVAVVVEAVAEATSTFAVHHRQSRTSKNSSLLLNFKGK